MVWDNKAMHVYSTLHPEVLAYRKVGEPSVQIRARSAKRSEQEERGMPGTEGRTERWLVPVLIFVGTLAALTWIRVRRLGLWAILTGVACVILGYGIAWWRQERPRR